ncbi:MAG: hypothetical protein Q7S00_07150 [bacterium]|nr:hypothetical protein [bacterium]
MSDPIPIRRDDFKTQFSSLAPAALDGETIERVVDRLDFLTNGEPSTIHVSDSYQLRGEGWAQQLSPVEFYELVLQQALNASYDPSILVEARNALLQTAGQGELVSDSLLFRGAENLYQVEGWEPLGSARDGAVMVHSRTPLQSVRRRALSEVSQLSSSAWPEGRRIFYYLKDGSGFVEVWGMDFPQEDPSLLAELNLAEVASVNRYAPLVLDRSKPFILMRVQEGRMNDTSAYTVLFPSADGLRLRSAHISDYRTNGFFLKGFELLETVATSQHELGKFDSRGDQQLTAFGAAAYFRERMIANRGTAPLLAFEETLAWVRDLDESDSISAVFLERALRKAGMNLAYMNTYHNIYAHYLDLSNPINIPERFRELLKEFSGAPLRAFDRLIEELHRIDPSFRFSPGNVQHLLANLGLRLGYLSLYYYTVDDWRKKGFDIEKEFLAMKAAGDDDATAIRKCQARASEIGIPRQQGPKGPAEYARNILLKYGLITSRRRGGGDSNGSTGGGPLPSGGMETSSSGSVQSLQFEIGPLPAELSSPTEVDGHLLFQLEMTDGMPSDILISPELGLELYLNGRPLQARELLERRPMLFLP